MTVQPLSNTNGTTTRPGSSNGAPSKPISEIIANGFFTVDNKWTVKYWNKAAERLLGVQSKDIVGKNLWEEFAGTIPLEFYTVYHKAFQGNIPVHFEEYWGEMGAWFDVIIYHCEDTVSVSFKSSNQQAYPEYRSHPEQKLRIVNELYKFVTQVTNDCLWEWNIQAGEIFWIDGGHKRVFGYEIENAIIPQSFWESRIHPDDRIHILARLNKFISEHPGSLSLWEAEYRFQKGNGEYAYVHDRGHIIYDDGSNSARMIGATQDITARKLAEIELLQSERKLSLIARQTENAITITDGEGKINWVNNAFTRITEYRADEVIGRQLGSFLQGKETDLATLRYLRQKIREKQSFNCDIINYSKSGRKYWMHIQGQPLLDEDGNYERYFVVQSDISERVLLENKLRDERLARQKEITLAVLTAQENERSDIGRELHDNLNQNLAVAKMYIQMSKTHESNSDMYLDKSLSLVANVIEEIRKIAKNLVIPGTHITGLLDNINNLVHDIATIHSVNIEFHSDGIDEKELDEKLQLTFFRIVQEQMNNILKHANASQVTIDLSKNNNEVTLLIADNGVGCDLAKGKKGVGIINIKGRVELYNGNVTIISKPGEGFELKVVLPVNATPQLTGAMKSSAG